MTDYNYDSLQLLEKLADPQLKKKDCDSILKKLRKKLKHPGVAASFEALLPDHPLRKEARTVADAFQGVTNGMRDNELMIQLNRIPVSSALYPWKSFVLAIDVLYHGHRLEACQALSLVEQDTPPGRLSRLLLGRLLSDQNRKIPETANEQVFLDSLLKQNPFLLDISRQLLDCIDSGLDDILLDTIILYLKELKKQDYKGLHGASLWCIEVLNDRELLDQDALQRFCGLLGRKQSLRLFALVTMKEEPARSLFYWMGALEACQESETPSQADLRAYLTIIVKLWRKTADVFQLSQEFTALFEDRFVHLFQRIFTSRFQDFDAENLDIEEKMALAEQLLSSAKEENRAQPARQLKKSRQGIDRSCKQLEFAFG